MLCIIPVAASDVDVLPAFEKSMRHFGPYPEDTCLFVVTPEVNDFRPDMMERVHSVMQLFRKEGSELKITPNTPEGGWPMAPNIHFMYAINFLKEMNNREPFMYLETDSTPLCRGWLSELKRDYAVAEKPYSGAVVPTYKIYRDIYPEGHPQAGQFKGEEYMEQEDTHMVGMGIYPFDYIYRSGPQASAADGRPVLHNVNILWKFPDSKEPFDITCQNYHRPCHNTKLIKHLWGTKNYALSGNDISCEDVNVPKTYKLKQGSNMLRDIQLSNAGIHSLEGAVIVHGCKDGSLADLVVSGKIRMALSTEEFPPIDSEKEALRQENAQLKEKFSSLESKLDMLLQRELDKPAVQGDAFTSPQDVMKAMSVARTAAGFDEEKIEIDAEDNSRIIEAPAEVKKMDTAHAVNHSTKKPGRPPGKKLNPIKPAYKPGPRPKPTLALSDD